MAVNNNLYPPVINSYMPAFLADSGSCRIYFSLSEYNDEDDIKYVQLTATNQNSNLSILDSGKYPSGIMITTMNKDDNRTTDDCYYVELKTSDIMKTNIYIVAGDNLSNAVVEYAVFYSQISAPGTYNFIYSEDENSWMYNNETITLADYGISVNGTPTEGDTLRIINDGDFIINQYYKIQLRFTGNNATDYPVSATGAQAISTWLIANQAYFSEWSTICLIRPISTPIISIEGFDTLGTEVV